jgi:polyisoprenoid-binding protein YceI
MQAPAGNVKRRLVAAGLVLCAPPAICSAAEMAWRVDAGQVVIVVPLKPGGAFEAKTSSLAGRLALTGSGAPMALEGELAVDLASIETGIALRDQHLRERYLEIPRGTGFDRAVLSDIVLRDADGAGFRGDTAFEGTLLLHDVRRPLAGKGVIRAAPDGVRVEASFALTLTDFGIVPPEYMGVGVASKVAVRVSFEAVADPGDGR